MHSDDSRLVQIVPSRRQLEFQQLEFYSFIHFTVNTFTGKEWGDGTEHPSVFHPTGFDASQWVRAVKSAGMTGLILTCKHHDGFCLWPSAYTRHSVAHSPYKGGGGDIVKEVADACREGGLRFGVYLSPWDRNHPTYGQGKAYDDYFVNQLTELLTNYGDIFSVWFDGACGEGRNGKKQFYDWDRYYEVIRTLQPGACINVCGPDIRWCGNEAGQTRTAEWSVVPERTRDTERIASQSQSRDDTEFRQRTISASDQDLGSREILKNEPKLVWYPAEVNTSIRPGWFYHEEEDDQVRPLEELISIYMNSVGGNATFLLNTPPTKAGLIHDNDVRRLGEIGAFLGCAFRTNLLDSARLSASSFQTGHEIDAVRHDGYESYFCTRDGVTEVVIEVLWAQPVSVQYVVMKENLLLSQRIETYEVACFLEGAERSVSSGTVVGYQRIVRFASVRTDRLRIRILDARVAPTLAFLGVY